MEMYCEQFRPHKFHSGYPLIGREGRTTIVQAFRFLHSARNVKYLGHIQTRIQGEAERQRGAVTYFQFGISRLEVIRTALEQESRENSKCVEREKGGYYLQAGSSEFK